MTPLVVEDMILQFDLYCREQVISIGKGSSIKDSSNGTRTESHCSHRIGGGEVNSAAGMLKWCDTASNVKQSGQ